MVPDKEDAVQSNVLDMPLLPCGRTEMFIISNYEVSVFSDVEAAVTAAPEIVCNSGLNIVDIIMVVKHN